MQRRSRYEAAPLPASTAASVLSAAAGLVSGAPAPASVQGPLDVAYARLQPLPASTVAFATLGYRDGGLHVWRIGRELHECAAIHPVRPAFPRVVHVAAHPTATEASRGVGAKDDAFASHRPLLLVAGFPDDTGHSSVLLLEAATGECVHVLRFAAAICGLHSNADVVVVACAHALYGFCSRTMRLSFKVPCAPHPWGDASGTVALGAASLAWSPAVAASLYDPGALPQPLADAAAAAAAGDSGHLLGSIEARSYVRPGHGTRVHVDSPHTSARGAAEPVSPLLLPAGTKQGDPLDPPDAPLAGAAGGDGIAASVAWRETTLSAAKAVAAGVSHLTDAAIESAVQLLGGLDGGSVSSDVGRQQQQQQRLHFAANAPAPSVPLLLPGFICVASVNGLSAEYADFSAALATGTAAGADAAGAVDADNTGEGGALVAGRLLRPPRHAAGTRPPLPHQQDRPGSSSLVFLHSGLQWRARAAAVATMAWDADESLLAVADVEGQDVTVFRPVRAVSDSPGCGQALLPLQSVSIHALYSRGVRLARITRLAFSASAEWLCGTSDHGTTHVWHCGGRGSSCGTDLAHPTVVAAVDASGKVRHRPALAHGRVLHEKGVAAVLSSTAAAPAPADASGSAFAEGGLVGAVVEQLRQWHLQVVVRAGGAVTPDALEGGLPRPGGGRRAARALRHVLTVPAIYDAIFVGSRLACLSWDGRLHLYDLYQDATYCRLEPAAPPGPTSTVAESAGDLYADSPVEDLAALPSSWQHVSAEAAGESAPNGLAPVAPSSARQDTAGDPAVTAASSSFVLEPQSATGSAGGGALLSLSRRLSMVSEGVTALAQRTANAALRTVAGAIVQASTSAPAIAARGIAADFVAGALRHAQGLASSSDPALPVVHSRTLRIAFLAHAPAELLVPQPPPLQQQQQQQSEEAPWRLRSPLVSSSHALGTWSLRRQPHWPDICDRAALDGLVMGEGEPVAREQLRPPGRREQGALLHPAPVSTTVSEEASPVATVTEGAAAGPKPPPAPSAAGVSGDGVAGSAGLSAPRASAPTAVLNASAPEGEAADLIPASPTGAPATVAAAAAAAAAAASAATEPVLPASSSSSEDAARSPRSPSDDAAAPLLPTDGWLDFDIDLELPPAAALEPALPAAEMALAMSTVLARPPPQMHWQKEPIAAEPPAPEPAASAAKTAPPRDKRQASRRPVAASRLPLLLQEQFSVAQAPPEP